MNSAEIRYSVEKTGLLFLEPSEVLCSYPDSTKRIHLDAHIYTNHLEQVELQLSRDPKPLPEMHLNPHVKNILDFKYEDFELVGYEAHPHIKGKVAV